MISDYVFYLSQYVGKADAAMQEHDFEYYEKQAELEVNLATFGRIKNIQDPSEDVKMCLCELAEFLYSSDRIESESGGAGVLKSFSNDGQSGSYDLSSSRYVGNNKEREKAGIIRKHLAFSGLLYRGI